MKKESLYNEINDNSSSKEEKPHLSMHTNDMIALGNEFVECEEMQYIEDPIENAFENSTTPKEIYLSLKPYIQDMSNKYEVPVDLLITIIHQESGGQWNTNGVCSYTDDYGLTQINECNIEMLKRELGFIKEDILYNPKCAIEAQAFLIKNIMNMYHYNRDTTDYENVFGTYNGWINWREKEMAVYYAASCMNILEQGVEQILNSVEKIK